ncbi:MAG TPA: aldose 1-epimerase family protein [Ktedonobacteraceae bacterium]
MTLVYGVSTIEELRQRIGNIRQIAGYQRVQLQEGRGKGNEVLLVRNGSGLSFQISLSRAFDIGLCELYGIPISWMSAAGPVSPHFYEKDGREWSRSFEGGLLATCGLTYMGKPNVDEGEALGLHGRISSTPAELLRSETVQTNDGYACEFRGRVRQSSASGENIALLRTIRTIPGSNRISIVDEITNEAFKPVEHMVLYHFNFGFPLVSETCHISIPEAQRRQWIQGNGPIEGWDRFPEPSDAGPTVLLHEGVQDEHGRVQLAVENQIIFNGQKKRMQVGIRYPHESCPFLTQWRNPASGGYVLGLEPGNASTEGRATHRQRGTLPRLQAQETRRYEFTLDFSLTD